MSKINEIAAEFADLNMQIITDIKKRGYSDGDVKTLETIRENILMLKNFAIDSEPQMIPDGATPIVGDFK